MSTKGLVLDIDRFSTHDGPGIRTAVFLKGCPLSCRWCHSPESQTAGEELLYQRMRCTGCGACASACPCGVITHDGEILEGNCGITIHREKCARCFGCVKACLHKALRKAGTEFSPEELIASVKPDLRFFKNSGGGITVTGGEPLSQPDFTYELLSGCHALGINTILETSGQGSWEKLKMIAGVCSMVYFDIKIIDPGQHRQWTGLSNERILDNLRNLCSLEERGRKILARVPCIPGVNDSAENIREIALFAASLGVESMQLLPYNIMAGEKYRWIGRDYSLDKIETRNRDYYEELNRLVETTGLTVLR